jgi:hypothetical protein
MEAFIEQVAERYGVERRSGVTLIGSRGQVAVKYLTRRVNGRVFDVTLPDTEGPLRPRVLGQLCEKLNIPLEDFGLDLGQLPPPDESFSL